MDHYRIHFIGKDENPSSAIDFQAASDADALAHAANIKDSTLPESWRGTKLIGNLSRDSVLGSERL